MQNYRLLHHRTVVCLASLLIGSELRPLWILGADRNKVSRSGASILKASGNDTSFESNLHRIAQLWVVRVWVARLTSNQYSSAPPLVNHRFKALSAVPGCCPTTRGPASHESQSNDQPQDSAKQKDSRNFRFWPSPARRPASWQCADNLAIPSCAGIRARFVSSSD